METILLFFYVYFYFLKDFIYLLLERGREGETEGEKHQCVVASREFATRDLARNLDTCPRLGIEPATLWFAGWHSIHWATPVRCSAIFAEEYTSTVHKRGIDLSKDTKHGSDEAWTKCRTVHNSTNRLHPHNTPLCCSEVVKIINVFKNAFSLWFSNPTSKNISYRYPHMY